MIRWIAIVVLCLGVATLGFARPCPCDYAADDAVVGAADPAEHDCPHSAPAKPADPLTPEGAHDCAHCNACVLTPAMPLPLAGGVDGAPAHSDFAQRVLPPCRGAESLPLRPPIA